MGAMAKAKLDQAKVIETLAKVDEIEAGAEHKRTQTELDLVKSMIELETMDLEQIGRAYEIAMTIKGQNSPESNKMALAS